MRQMCLLVAMSMISSVSGETCEQVWAEINALRYTGRDRDLVRRQVPVACGQRESLSDDENETFNDEPDDLNKILGGSFARRGEFPWQANIYVVAPHVCGGVILNNFWILTAASCVYNVTSVIWQVKIVVGGYSLEIIDKEQMSLSPEKIFIHQRFNPSVGYDYDIALIKVCNMNPIVFNGNTRPICLPEPGEVVPTGTELTFSGWGRDNTLNDEIPATLKKVDLPVIDHTVCSNEVYPGYITDRMLCAGEVDGNTDACIGDVGGPAVYKSGDKFVLAGIMVGGIVCSLPNYPVIFSNVSAYRTWIDDAMALDDNLGEVEIRRI